MRIAFTVFALMLAMFASSATAGPIYFFDFDDTDDAEDALMTVGPVTASLRPTVDGSPTGNAALNRANNEFGVSYGTDGQIDYRGNVIEDFIEGIRVSFDQDVFLQSIELSSFQLGIGTATGSIDRALILFEDGSPSILLEATSTEFGFIERLTYDIGRPLAANQWFEVRYAGTQAGHPMEGFGYAGLTIELPEPGTVALLLVGGVLVTMRGRGIRA